MRYHDFHLADYSVRKFGGEIVLHLVYDYPSKPTEESHIRFVDVELYHFVHTGAAIITDILEVPITQIFDQFWDRMAEWYHQHGGISLWEDTRSMYQGVLESESYKAWEIASAVGFGGFVIAKAIVDVTHEYTPTT